MGKIFDALEKATGQIGVLKSLPLEKSKKKGKQRQTKDNVVPFANRIYPIAGPKLDYNLVVFHSPRSIEAELFKVLRTNLLFPANGKPPKSILVTSAIPGDGKSLVSSNLAISIAQGIEEHVLLIDADIRKPSIDRYFDLGAVEGLSEYLSAGHDVSNKFVKTPIEKLTLLPAGCPPENPTELLTTQKMKTLIKEVTQRYEDRYIIIDSAPPSVAPETSAIANYVDGIILVIKSGKTPRAAISEVIEQLGKDKIQGLVLNHSSQVIKKYYGYGKSYYEKK